MKVMLNKIDAVAILLLSSLNVVLGIRFVIDREECFSHYPQYEGDTIYASFVVISNTDTTWQLTQEGLDLVLMYHTTIVEDSITKRDQDLKIDSIKDDVKGPSGDQVQDFHDKTSEKFEFIARARGPYRFCFTNKSPYREKVDFDVHSNHFSTFDQPAQDEHLVPLLEQIIKLEEALFNIQYEQHWLEAQTERQAVVNNAMSSRAFHKALLESAALIGASTLQVYLLRRLFERKLGL